MYTDTKIFAKDIISTYEIIFELIRINGDSGIVNRKRQETYKKAITTVKEIDTKLELSKFVSCLEDTLTEKPKKIMKDLLKKGEVILEDKPPYNGTIVRNGKIVGEEGNEMEAFKNLSILSGIGIGLGDSGIKELVKMGYNSIEQLKDIYEEDKFENFRKGLQGPLRKYFEGTVRIEKMSREEAGKWGDVISKIVENAVVLLEDSEKETVIIKHKMAGSYARKQKEIGDIDYLIVVNDKTDPEKANNVLYKIMLNVLDDLAEVNDIDPDKSFPVSLDSVTETPSKAIKDKRYTTAIKMWFKVGNLKTKIEIYGYTNTQFVFPYFARAGEVNLQKKVKLHALKRGYKLSPWGLDFKDTDKSIENDSEQIYLIKQKIGKEKIETIRELFDFLNYGE
jgi:DNA polymerase/3'-5' exonuclease PolX